MSRNTVSHYRIMDRQGQGGMLRISLAEDSTPNCRVAMKVFSDVFAADPERLARFKPEARLPASLNHPNIASIHGLERAEGSKMSAVSLSAQCPACDKKHLIRFRPPFASQSAQIRFSAHPMKLEGKHR